MLISHGLVWKLLGTLFVLNLFVMWMYFHDGKSADNQAAKLKPQSELKENDKTEQTVTTTEQAVAADLKNHLSPLNPEFIELQLPSAAEVEESHPEIDANILIQTANHHLPKINFEERVSLFAQYYRHFKHEFNPQTNSKKPLLCSSMISLTHENIDYLLPSIEQSDNKCDWLVIIYSTPMPTDTKLNEQQHKEYMVAQFNTRVAAILGKLHASQPVSQTAPTTVKLEFAVDHSTLLTEINGLCQKYIKRKVISANSAGSSGSSGGSGDFLSTFEPCDMSPFALLTTDRSSTTTSTAGNAPEKTTPYNHIIYPKISLFYSFLPYLSKYNHIWLVVSICMLFALFPTHTQ